jgi:ribosomal protein S18 acetylase RimI-like enzyme
MEQDAEPAIAPEREADIDELIALARAIWHAHYPGMITVEQIEYMLEQRYRPDLIRSQLTTPGVWWDKLTAGGRMVAFSCCELTGHPGELKLDKLYVDHRLHGKGYGSRLLRNVDERARAAGCTRVYLQVNKNNRGAVAAYERNGFSVEQAATFDIGNGFIMDDYIMAKRIDPVAPSVSPMGPGAR